MSSFPKELCIPIRSPLNEMDTEKQTFGCRQAIQIFVVTVILKVYVLLLPKTQFVNIHLLSGKKYIQNLRRVTSEVLQTKRFVHRHC